MIVAHAQEAGESRRHLSCLHAIMTSRHGATASVTFSTE